MWGADAAGQTAKSQARNSYATRPNTRRCSGCGASASASSCASSAAASSSAALAASAAASRHSFALVFPCAAVSASQRCWGAQSSAWAQEAEAFANHHRCPSCTLANILHSKAAIDSLGMLQA